MFEKVNSKVVKVDLSAGGGVVARNGAMLFYTGECPFTPHEIPGGGVPGHGRHGGLVGWPAGRWPASTSAPWSRRAAARSTTGSAGLEVHGGPGAAGRPVCGSRHPAAGLHRRIADFGGVGESSGGGGGGGLMGRCAGCVRGALTGQGMFTTQLSGQGAAVLLSHGGIHRTAGGRAGSGRSSTRRPSSPAYGNVRTELGPR